MIELMGEDVSVCLPSGQPIPRDSDLGRDLLDCIKPGDAEEACSYILDHYEIQWCIVVAKMDESGYENRAPTPAEKRAMCESIYFDSEYDFSDERLAEIYLVWQAASQIESEKESES